jgi:hypothetical protein
VAASILNLRLPIRPASFSFSATCSLKIFKSLLYLDLAFSSRRLNSPSERILKSLFNESSIDVDNAQITNLDVSGTLDLTGASISGLTNVDLAGTLTTNTINEHTVDAGVTVENVLHKDGKVSALSVALNYTGLDPVPDGVIICENGYFLGLNSSVYCDLDIYNGTGIVNNRHTETDGLTLDNLNTTIGLGGLTTSEVNQLKNIDTNVISNAQWTRLTNINQNLTTTDAPIFAGLTINGNIGVSGNVDDVKIRKMASTGLLYGGMLSIGTGGSGVATTFNLSSGAGQIVDNTFEPNIISSLSWNTFTDYALTYLNTNAVSFIAIDGNGNIIQQTTDFTAAQYRQYVVIGVVVHSNLTTVNAVNQSQNIIYDIHGQYHDIAQALGIFNINGNVISANGFNIFLNKSSLIRVQI